MLHADEATWEELFHNRHAGRRFSIVYPHLVARAARPSSLAFISAESANPGLFVGLVRSILKVSTLESRVVFDLVRHVSPGALLELLGEEGEAAGEIGRVAVRIAVEGGHQFHPIPLALARPLVRRIIERAENAPVLQPIADYINQPTTYRNARALQDDAVQMALKVFGADVKGGTLSLTGRDTALTRTGLQEDLAIEHDARWVHGWRLEESDLTGRAVFRSDSDQLTVFTANRQALEELFGVDLIYLNERRGSLVMVQYKMMNASTVSAAQNHGGGREKEWTVRVDAHFLDQIARMTRFDGDFAPDGPYRLNSGAFYFKFVKRDASRRTAGIMISLDHLQGLLDAGAQGPRNGLRVSYQQLDGHYLRGEPFADLVRSGYIGTRGATTEHLQVLIDVAINEGRAAVAAINSRLPR